jgi:WD40 repeat protein
MRGQTGRKELMARLGIGRVGVSWWSRWLWLWLACVMVLPTFAQGRPDIVWMRGRHTDGVSSVAFSPDGSLLASGSRDRTIKLWRVADGSLVRTITGHTGEVNSVAFSPDGSLLASGSEDRTVKLWRVADGALLRTLEGHTGSVRSVAFSPDGSLLASAGQECVERDSWGNCIRWRGTIRLWRVADGSLVRTLHGAHRWGHQRGVFARWELAGVGEWVLGSHHQVVACGGWRAAAHP